VHLTSRVGFGLLWLALAGVWASTAQEAPPTGRLEAAAEKLEAHLAELEVLEQSWLESKARIEELAVLEAELAASDRRSPQVDQIYEAVNPLVEWSIGEVAAALDRAVSPSELPAWALRRVSPSDSVKAFGGSEGNVGEVEATFRLEELSAQLHQTGSRLRELEVELRRVDVERDTELASRIYRLRLAALHRLSVEHKLAVYGLGRRAMEAIQLERKVLETGRPRSG
jgi:hypothetical protein